MNNNVYYEVLRYMDLSKYLGKLREYIKRRMVFIVPIHGWSEFFLHDWFARNYKSLGFTTVAIDRSPQYMLLKSKMNFYGYPDFLGKRDDKWLRIEIESFSSQYKYSHSPEYADAILCYEKDEEYNGIEIYEFKTILGFKDIINLSEIYEYLYIHDDEFREEHDHYLPFVLAMMRPKQINRIW